MTKEAADQKKEENKEAVLDVGQREEEEGGKGIQEREGKRGRKMQAFSCPLSCTQKAQVRVQSPLWINILLQINKTTALPPSNFVAKQFVEGKGWNLDIPFSCLRNLRTLNLVGFQIDGIN